MSIDRRNFLKTGAIIALGSSSIVGVISASQAYKQKSPLQVLSATEANTLNSLGEQLVIGAKQAGLVHFIDYQLSIDPNDCMLIAKYFQVTPPYIDFYRAGLRSLDQVCNNQHQKPFHKLPAQQAQNLVERLSNDSVKDWLGPPASLFYLLVRSDAVDVVYGTPEGFAKLSIPYMAHIMPPENWQDD